jgi:hypothetical protein
MSLCKSCARNSLLYVATVLLLLSTYGFLYPALDWPDEYRNVGLLQEGEESGYALIYGNFTRTIVGLSASVAGNSSVQDAQRAVTENPSFKMVNGGLRYLTISSVPAAYYFAKLSNILLVSLFSGIVLLYLCQRGRFEGGNSSYHAQIYLLSLASPAVAYGVMQISTDILFILFSLLPFFIKTKRNSRLFALLMLPLAFEDRSFLIISLFVVLKEFLAARLLNRLSQTSSTSKVLMLLVGVSVAIFLANVVEAVLLDGMLLNAVFPGLGSVVSASLEYTHTKSFDTITSLIVFYAGIIIMPSGTELFVKYLPIYIAYIPIFYYVIRGFVRKDENETSRAGYIALLAMLMIFFFMTQAVHVFESGRYYLFIVPYCINALIEGRRFIANRKIMMLGTFVAIAIFSVTLAQLENNI